MGPIFKKLYMFLVAILQTKNLWWKKNYFLRFWYNKGNIDFSPGQRNNPWVISVDSKREGGGIQKTQCKLFLMLFMSRWWMVTKCNYHFDGTCPTPPIFANLLVIIVPLQICVPSPVPGSFQRCLCIMAIQVMEFQVQGYKIRKMFA